MAISFRGGIHPEGHKETASKPIETMPLPEQVILPLSMHIGAECQPIVKKGDHVFLGQKIADSQAPVSSTVHATVSGTVADIAVKKHPDGSNKKAIIIDNDFSDELDQSIKAIDPLSLSQDEFVEHVRQAGIVGHGGAAFPTYFKIKSALGKIDSILINGAECEPYITSDQRIMLEHPAEVIGGARILLNLFKLEDIKICIETNKKEVVPVLREHIPESVNIKIIQVATKYPQGAEKQLINAVLKREVPSGKLPADVGCAVFNIDTVAAIYRLFNSGMPALRRIVTVSGGAVSNPKNLLVRIGTPVRNLLETCGGLKKQVGKLIMGGPMMGTSLYNDEVPVIKGTNAILALARDEINVTKDPHCIRCGKCIEVCPMRIMPIYIYQAALKGDAEHLEKYDTMDCMECGSCAFVCPGKLQLVQGIRVGKQRLTTYRKAAAK